MDITVLIEWKEGKPIDKSAMSSVLAQQPPELLLQVLRDEMDNGVSSVGREFIRDNKWRWQERLQRRIEIPLADVLSVEEPWIYYRSGYTPFANINRVCKKK